MLAEVLLLASAFQIGPFYEERPDFAALRPFYSREKEDTDVLWPIFTMHRDWWRFCFFTHYQEYENDGYQFEIMPFWVNGRTRDTGEEYWGLFPIYGHHPHLLLMYDLDIALWPIWTTYQMPRPSENRWMRTRTVLFPFFSWRDDGTWSFWPFYGITRNRADYHRYICWPLINYKECLADRDTAGAGTAWMVWPLFGSVDRERESQKLVLPPFFSYVETPQGWRGRYPWPLVEIERFKNRERTSIFPFYEHIVNRSYFDGSEVSQLTRFGWHLVELLPDETRVFPFYVKGKDYLRIWPFWESSRENERETGRLLCLFPIRHVPAVDRNWAKFWTFYERESEGGSIRHSLFWGIIRWSTDDDER